MALATRNADRTRGGRFCVDVLLSRPATSLVHAASAHPSRSPPLLLGSRRALDQSAKSCSTASSAPFPILIVAAFVWQLSWPGALLGLVLGQLHVWWRHTTELGWRTPAWVLALARPLQIVLPEDHDGHHRNPDIEFGDIFRFYDAPARFLLAKLAPTSRRTRNAALRRTKRAPVRA